MFYPKRNVKRIPELRWAQPERIFFACGACHILAYAFLERFPGGDFRAIWMKPASGFIGNHVVATDGETAFDFHGYSRWDKLLAHARRKNGQRMPGWSCTLIELPADVLISEEKSRTYDGLWLRGPKQYLHDAMPRARAFVRRFAVPSHIGDRHGTARPGPAGVGPLAGVAVAPID
jgi:hypothetical protein